MNIEQINQKLEEIRTSAGTIKINRNLSFLCLGTFALDSSVRLQKLIVGSTITNAFLLGIESLFITLSAYDCLTNQSELVQLQKQSKELIEKKQKIFVK